MVVYISGKYSGKTISIVQQNTWVAKKVSYELWRKGFAVVCPHMNCSGLEANGIRYNEIMRGCLEILSRCDAIIMLPGWEDSKGAVEEEKYASEKRIMIYKYPELPPLPGFSASNHV